MTKLSWTLIIALRVPSGRDSCSEDPMAIKPKKKKRKTGPSGALVLEAIPEAFGLGEQLLLYDSPQLNPYQYTANDLFDDLDMDNEVAGHLRPSSSRGKCKRVRKLWKCPKLSSLSALIMVREL